ncbi:MULTISPECIES: hypothetical protein [unclassified Psychrobacter]|uniref:hypothetical protein n=1 Tax=unclassified Psychrobacter TaxID=196806 RepID=UPI0025B52122|nr:MULTISPECIES: hypothetical protein [unclassified Psychrobacter]MDN3451903.1 hypothetical protein [Psychrobacter sp. APC 3350]MDN3501873.1 hypothetical protein [Psychrobacter sp. 5A.1]
MIKDGFIVLGLLSAILMSTGCDETRASSDSEVKAVALENAEKEVQLRGKFKRSFEVHELESNGSIYYVSDPKQLLIKAAKGINQDGYYKFFETCIVGNVSAVGQYGPLGKYQKQITVRGICA